MDIKALSQKYSDYGIQRRHYYHAHPELPEQETETCAQIQKDLLALGISDIRPMQHCHGLVADIHGAFPGRTVALRTDIDALPVKEATGLPFASQNDNVMHACGHDSHIAILLEAAKILQECRGELHGTVRLLVQPSEELANGARAMMAEGALEGVDAIYGSHVMGTLSAPCYAVSPGPVMAGAGRFTIRVDGMAAHGSEPNRGKDAITIASAIVNNLQQCVSRMNDPQNPLVITVGTIHGGTRFNIIPNMVTMEGTVRSFTDGAETEAIMRRIIENTAAAFGTTAVLELEMLTPAVIHRDEALVTLAKAAAEKIIDPACVCSMRPLMGSEDFAFYMEKVPGIFGILGVYDETKGHVYSNHHEKFDFEEDVIARGAGIMAQFAADYLKEGV